MANGFEDFSGATIGVAHPDFTLVQFAAGSGELSQTVENTAGSLSGKALQVANSGNNAWGFLTWDFPAAFADGEVTVLLRCPNTLSGPSYGPLGRMDGNDPPTMVGGNADVGGDLLRLTYWNASDTGVASTTQAFVLDADERVWVRFNFNGTAYKVKGWLPDSQPEPGAWDIDTTDANPTTASGAPGILVQPSTGHTVIIEGIGYSDNPEVSAPLSGGSVEAFAGRTRGRIASVSQHMLRRGL